MTVVCCIFSREARTTQVNTGSFFLSDQFRGSHFGSPYYKSAMMKKRFLGDSSLFLNTLWCFWPHYEVSEAKKSFQKSNRKFRTIFWCVLSLFSAYEPLSDQFVIQKLDLFINTSGMKKNFTSTFLNSSWVIPSAFGYMIKYQKQRRLFKSLVKSSEQASGVFSPI